MGRNAAIGFSARTAPKPQLEDKQYSEAKAKMSMPELCLISATYEAAATLANMKELWGRARAVSDAPLALVALSQFRGILG